jgi:hypothetical protein
VEERGTNAGVLELRSMVLKGTTLEAEAGAALLRLPLCPALLPLFGARLPFFVRREPVGVGAAEPELPLF